MFGVTNIRLYLMLGLAPDKIYEQYMNTHSPSWSCMRMDNDACMYAYNKMILYTTWPSSVLSLQRKDLCGFFFTHLPCQQIDANVSLVSVVINTSWLLADVIWSGRNSFLAAPTDPSTFAINSLPNVIWGNGKTIPSQQNNWVFLQEWHQCLQHAELHPTCFTFNHWNVYPELVSLYVLFSGHLGCAVSSAGQVKDKWHVQVSWCSNNR